MGGAITGLDIGSCLSLPSLTQFDPEIIEELLMAIEQGALVGMHKREKEEHD